MRIPETKFDWQRGWVVVLALVSLVVPVAAVMLRQEPVEPFTDPARVRYYRQTIATLIVGLACAVGAFIGIRTEPTAGIRWLSVVLASVGALANAFLYVRYTGLGHMTGALRHVT